MKAPVIFLLLLASTALAAQQPQTQNAPVFAANAEWVNGVAPGYWPTAGSGLTLNISAGTAFCGGVAVNYAGSTLTMSNSATNYVYLNTASSCVPASNTSSFSSTNIPIAIVVASGGAITSITDARTMFFPPGSGGSGDTITSPNSTISIGGTTTNTTLDLAGAAGKIMAGATPALTYTPALGVDGSNAGTLQLANGSAAFHTILGTQASASWTFKFPATAGTSGFTLKTDGSGNASWVAHTGWCEEVWGGSGTSFALTSGDDAVANNTCYNDTGQTWTITAVKCRSDNASNTTTVNLTFGPDGTGTSLLSGALTCGSSYAMSSTGSISNASVATGNGFRPVMGGTLTGTSIVVHIDYTVPLP